MTNRRAIAPWIVLHVVFFGIGWCAATFPSRTSASLGIASGLSVLAVALLSFREFIRWQGSKKGLAILMCLCLYALVIEMIGVQTGFPYGLFRYQSIPSFQIAGVPWTTPFAWAPLVLAAFFISRSWITPSSQVKRLVLAVALLVGLDLVLDPGAVVLGLWSYTNVGLYYGIPWTNILGWILTGGIALIALERTTPSHAPPHIVPFLIGPSSLIAFWIGVTSNARQLIPSLIGVGLMVVFTKTWFDKK